MAQSKHKMRAKYHSVHIFYNKFQRNHLTKRNWYYITSWDDNMLISAHEWPVAITVIILRHVDVKWLSTAKQTCLHTMIYMKSHAYQHTKYSYNHAQHTRHGPKLQRCYKLGLYRIFYSVRIVGQIVYSYSAEQSCIHRIRIIVAARPPLACSSLKPQRQALPWARHSKQLPFVCLSSLVAW